MRIFVKTLRMKNFKPIQKEVNLDFSKDAAASFIQGDNGFGKSTVMEAIALCLDDFKKGKTYGDYVNWDAAERNEGAEVNLVAEVNDKELKINITISSEGELYREALWNGETKIGTKVLELLEELGIREYSNIMFYLQGSPDITGKSPVELAEQLQKLFDYNLDPYLEQTDTTLLSERKDQIEKDLYNLKNTSYTKKELEKQEITPEEYTACLKKVSDGRAKATELQQETIELQKLKNQESECHQTLSEIYNTKMEDSNKIKALELYKEQKAEYDKKKSEIDVKLESASKKVKDLEAQEIPIEEFDAIEEQIEAIQLHSNYENAERDYNTNQENVKVFSEELEKLVSEINDMTEALRVLKSVEAGVCPTCHQPTTDLCNLKEYDYLKPYTSRGLQQLNQDLIDQRVKADGVKNHLNEASNSAAINQSKMEAVSKYKELPKELEGVKVEDLKAKLDEMSAKNAEINKDLKVAREELSKIEGMNSALTVPLAPRVNIEVIETRLKELNEKEKEVNEKLNTLKTDLACKKTVEELEAEIKKIDFSAEELKIKKYDEVEAQNKSTIEFNKKIEETEKQSKVKISEFEKELETVSDDINTRDESKTIIGKDLLNFITLKTCKKLENELNNFFNVIFPNLVVELKQKGKGVQFFYGKKDLKKRSDIRNTSGFEKQLLSIAWKVALSKAYGLSILFLDEADAYSSDTNSKKLYSKLISLGLFDQIFIITQDKNLYRELSCDFDLDLFEVSSVGSITKIV